MSDLAFCPNESRGGYVATVACRHTSNVDEDSDDGESDVVASGEHDEPDDEAG